MLFLHRFRVSAALAALVVCMPPAVAAGSDSYSGMVWEKHGTWYLNGGTTALRMGEAVPPGALLTADANDGAPAAVLLLPDGQRLLCECFDASHCAQGFRVPAITAPPPPAVWEMFVGVRNALLVKSATADAPFPAALGRDALAGRVEVVIPLTQPGAISLSSALTVLPSGKYTLSISEDAATSLAKPAVIERLEWAGAGGDATVHVPGPGVYRVRVADASSALRMQIEVLVTTADAFAREKSGLKQARSTVLQWSNAHQGWGLHDFLRAYLESRTGFAAD